MARLKDAPPRANLFAAVFLIPALLLSSAGYVENQDRIRGGAELDRVEQTIRDGWQSGDVIYVVGDGPLVNIMAAIPDLPIYRFPQCQPTTSYLSPETRQAIGAREVPLDQVNARRYWLVVGIVPFTPQCERDFIGSVTHTDGATLSSSLVFGGLYILEAK
jgi:hypothetical protein